MTDTTKEACARSLLAGCLWAVLAGEGQFWQVAAALPALPFAHRVQALQTATQIAVGSNHTCALTNMGAVWCWGYNQNGQLGNGTVVSSGAPVAVIGLQAGVRAIAAGGLHTCALTDAGGVWCWGSNWAGQLGDGKTGVTSTTPVSVTGLVSGVVTVTVGGSHTCALTSTGGAWCWGYNNGGQLGNGTMTNAGVPVAVSGMSSDVLAIAAGGEHTCALKTGSLAWCWGTNTQGQLGNGTTTTSFVPVPVDGLSSGVMSIAVGGTHTCAWVGAGAARCWGGNGEGQLGDGTKVNRQVPVGVAGLTSNVRQITSGIYHTCARTNAGAVFCWGNNWAGKLGNGTTVHALLLMAVSGLNGVGDAAAQIGAGYEHTCALTLAGAVLCWGRNNYGQLGNGRVADASRPVGVSGLHTGISAIAAGKNHNCALTSAGGVLCWGAGYLGDGRTTEASVPVGVSGLSSGVRALAPGWGHTCALTSASGVVCWGRNSSGQLGNGTNTSANVPGAVPGLGQGVRALAAGWGHVCALKNVGALLCWGYNSAGQLGNGNTVNANVPITITSLAGEIRAMAAGSEHTCAVLTFGAAQCWGANAQGQLGDGSTLASSLPVIVSGLGAEVSAIAAGGGFTCALTTLGAVRCWGDNSTGQLGNGTTLSSSIPVAVLGLGSGVSAIAAGEQHACALLQTGQVQCWGTNYFGQLGNGTTYSALAPVIVDSLPSAVVAISAGDAHSCALTGAGAAWCWGANQAGELGNGAAWTETPRGVLDFSDPLPQPVGDAFENDDSCGHAKDMEANIAPQAHTFDKLDDADWIRIHISADMTYTLVANKLTTGTLPAFSVYPSCVTGPITSSVVFGGESSLPIAANEYVPGIYYIKVTNTPTTTFGNDVSYTLSLRAISNVGAVIIVAGRNSQREHQHIITQTTDLAYHVLLRHGFTKTQILYLDEQTSRDVDNDNQLDDIDGPATVAEVQNAITVWAKDRVGPAKPLWLYMADHGWVDQFMASGDGAGDVISSAMLNSWLDQLEAETGVDQINIILDACYAGSFITPAGGSISQKDRAVLASTSDTKQAYGRRTAPERMYFGEALWRALDANLSLKDAFTQAQQAVATYQMAWLDDNGDGIANSLDGGMSEWRGLFGPAPTGGPHLTELQANTTTGDLMVNARAVNGVRGVRVEVVRPDTAQTVITGQVNLAQHDVVTLTYTSGALWVGRYDRFDVPGLYQLMAYGQGNDGGLSASVQISVLVGAPPTVTPAPALTATLTPTTNPFTRWIFIPIIFK